MKNCPYGEINEGNFGNPLPRLVHIFPLAMPAELSRPVQTFVLISSLDCRREQKEISI